jgi:DNA (cytosine-5)-methyltransferase 3A
MKPLTVLSLFDGIAGARLALQRAGLPLAAYYASEVSKYAMKVAKHNWNDEVRQIGDVRLLSDCCFGIDLLIGGSPCQGFSKVGTQLNFLDPRSELFFEFVRLKELVRPKWWLLENVVMKQEWEDVISSHLGTRPYLIDSSYFSAQSRPRHYWTNIPYTSVMWDKNPYYEHLLEDILIYDIDKIEPFMLSNKELAYMDRKTKDGRNHWDFHHHSHIDNDKSACVVANWKRGVPYNVLVEEFWARKFLPIEAERLQTYPDNYTAAPGLRDING